MVLLDGAFGRVLAKRFPEDPVRAAAAAAPAAASRLCCICGRAPRPADAAGLRGSRGLPPGPARAQVPSVERMVRQLLQYPRRPAVVFMQYFSYELALGEYFGVSAPPRKQARPGLSQPACLGSWPAG